MPRRRDLSLRDTPADPVDPRAALDDGALFRAAVGDVAPVASDLVEPSKPKPKPRPRQARADERAVVRELATVSIAALEAAVDEPLEYVRGGVNPRLLRDLGRGRYSPRAEIDLHGLKLATAEAALQRFISSARDSGVHCVRVIHGKGLNSPAGPVLKRLTDRVLRQRGDVVAFRAARIEDGGAGAAIVLLKKS